MTKTNFVTRRLLQMPPVLLGVSAITFALMEASPGDPVRALLGPRASQEAVAAARERYGLDEPVIVRYGVYLKNLVQGDWGHSISFNTPVLDLVLGRLAPTMYLVAGGLLLSTVAALVLSVLATLKQDSWADHVIRILSIVGLGTPAFWLGLVLMLIFSVRLGWLPATGFGDTFTSHLHHLILPWLTITVVMAPILVRNLRAAILQNKGGDVATAGRAKGLPEAYIFMRHILPNSILPSLHLLGIVTVYILGFSILIEPVFSMPGVGELFIDSIIGRDYLVVQGLTLLFALITLLATLAVDVLTVVIDPRTE